MLGEKQPADAGYLPLSTSESELPHPATTQKGVRSWSWRRGGVALLALVAIPLLLTHEEDLPLVDPVISDYWNGVASRGSGLVTTGNEGIPAAHHPSHPGRPGRPGHGGGHRPHWLSPKEAEKIFLEVPSNKSAASASERYTSHAHPAGSGWDFVTAVTVKNDWERALGLRVTGSQEHVYDAGSHQSQSRIRGGMDKLGVWIDTYYPVLNAPVGSSVTLLSDPPVKAKLQEAILEGDPDSVLRDEVRVFHGLSVSGDVTGKYVYAGYGTKRDFEILQERGIDFKDKIVLVKYGRVFRGLKVKAAQEAGAIGVIIFTDPGDDGEVTEANGYKQYPEGPARVPSSVQRGSVQFLSMYPGDPSTPGEPAYKNATRVEGGNFPSIPSLPLSYEDAIPILKALKGKGIPASDLDPSFEGGLGHYGVEYFTGPSDVDLHLVNEVNTRVTPIWNVMAVIPGHITDEVVLMGNHRDAWVLGGSDPNAGTSAQYEYVRGLGKLIKKGWKPLRTIVLASWDGEEYGLVGSTEWAEDFGDWLRTHAAAYLNLDSATSGQNFRGSASPSLALLLRGAAEEVSKGDDANRSVWDARKDGGDWDALFAENNLLPLEVSPEEAAIKAESLAIAGGSGINPLGSGSDYTAFLQRYGVASTDFSFGGGPKDAVYHYHSVYDSHTWITKFGDPTYQKHVAAAQIIGLLSLRLADSLILPFNTTQYTRDMGYYLQKIEDLKDAASSSSSFDLNLDNLRASIEQLTTASHGLDKKRHDLLAELHKVLHGNVVQTSYWERLLHLAGMCTCGEVKEWNKMEKWAAQGDLNVVKSEEDEKSRPKRPRDPKRWREIAAILKKIRAVNLKLRAFEAGFISKEGIKDREWYKHKGTAPGKWLGYGATTFPALTEAITIEKNATLAQAEADELTGMIESLTQRINV